MKENKEIEISFAGAVQEERVKEVELRGEESKALLEDLKYEDAVTKEEVEEVEEVDPYATAVEAFFAGYQAFQEGMKALQKFTQPKLIFGKLMGVLESFQGVIAEFKKADYTVPAQFQEGHDLILVGIAKYDRFLVEYPAVLQGKGGLKAMKKVTQLGKLSADADQDMKKAFRSFDEATQGE